MNWKKMYFIYDDRILPQNNIVNVVGSTSFGEVLHKREKLSDKIKKTLFEYKDIDIEGFRIVKSDQDLFDLNETILNMKNDTMIIHIMSYCVIVDKENFLLAVSKSVFSDSILVSDAVNPLVYFFPGPQLYLDYIKNLYLEAFSKNEVRFPTKQVIKPNEHVIDISIFQHFLQFFSGGFEARYFNSLKGDAFTLTKTSTDKVKIQKEHDLYQFLPSEIKNWFVAPFNLSIAQDSASYTMERLNVPDMALQWIHSAISCNELEIFLDKIFYYISRRPIKPVATEEYLNRFQNMYYTKVLERIDALKKLSEYATIEQFIKSGTNYAGIDEIFDDYKELFNRHRVQKLNNSVAGHGDLCFSNILYDKNTGLMKFIDPKGALAEQDIWMDPYYDIAKLSHSIFGDYDFINNEMFTIDINSSLKLELSLEKSDLSEHKETFYNKLLSNGYDPYQVRLCEASLFLSMLPLHIDNPRKVLGFIINAINILEELKSYAK